MLPIGFAILPSTQTEQEPAQSPQLSGEVETGIGPLGLPQMDAFLDAVTRSRRMPRRSARAARDQGVPISMVQEKINTPYHGKDGSANTASGQTSAFPAALSELHRPSNVWVSGYGAHGTAESEFGAGKQSQSFSNCGLAAGLSFSPGTGKAKGDCGFME